MIKVQNEIEFSSIAETIEQGDSLATTIEQGDSLAVAIEQGDFEDQFLASACFLITFNTSSTSSLLPKKMGLL